MPLYEYECQACGHRFEVIQKFSDARLTECPKCKGELKKLLSSPAIQFKGSGWYITDYARKGASSDSKTTTASKESPEKPAAPAAGSDTSTAPASTPAPAKPKSGD